MPHKFFIVLTGLMVFLNIFYGCTSLQKEPVIKNYFDLNINFPSSNQGKISIGQALLVKEFFINPSFDSHSFVYRVGENEYANDYYNEFVNYPAKLITEKIMEDLFASIHFKSVLSNQKQDIDYRLSGKITRLYGDFQDADHPGAIIEIRMILEKKTNNTFQAFSNKTYLSKEPIKSRKPAHLVSGWSLGLKKIVTRFIHDFSLTLNNYPDRQTDGLNGS